MRGMFGPLALVVTLATPVLAQDSALPRAAPIGNPGTWIPPDSYPVAAKASVEEGRVAFTLTIDESGRVSDCKITGTSDSPLLDETTCSLMATNGRFTPPRNNKNKPTVSQWSSSVRWKLETPPPPPVGSTSEPPAGALVWFAKDYVRETGARSWFKASDYPISSKRTGSTGRVVVKMLIGANGLPTSCWIMESSRIPDLDAVTCIAALKRAKFEPAKDNNGKAIEHTFMPPPVIWNLRN